MQFTNSLYLFFRNPSLVGFQSKRRRVHQAGTPCLTLGAVYLILAKVKAILCFLICSFIVVYT
jgi:hypothetical protein